MVEMTYNSTRSDLAIPEYGRTIQEMVEHLKSLADKEERNKCANAIVSIMGSVVPQEGDKEEVQKKLWGQLYLMANYDLDVDCPGETPTRESRTEPPARLDYPNAQSRLGHYGQMTRDLIEKAKTYEEGEEKAALVLTIANLMKRHYLTWNRATVENTLIAEQLKEMSDGALTLPEEAELVSSAEVLKSKRKTSDAMDRWRGKKKRR
ncbi:DUF4290 domain-containing protein [Flavobacteriales bacterium]|jgi:hypothetical protein|nr:DUF4290 domain-containing protein [Flavobacteriales bacterium]